MAKVCSTCGNQYGDADLFCPADGTTLQAVAHGDDLIGTVVSDRYLITDKIGEGGMGRVYLARHVRLPQNVAIKVLHDGMVRDPTVVARFRREAINASQIENEHVARVFDHGEVDGLFYIAMEYVEGEPLSKIILREGVLPLARAVDITRQVADALAAAHERATPIVHRDLKPDNIMVGQRRDGTDRVKVVDFGIAEAMSGGGPKLTQQGLVIGTPEYMSPEQLSAITLDWRSDIYSLALVTFYMLTGHLPFTGESPHEAALMRLRDRPKTLGEMKTDVSWPPLLQDVMDRALARAPTERYETAPEFARALAEAAGVGAPTVATTKSTGATRVVQQPTAPEQGRSRKALIGTTAVLAAALLVSVGIFALRRGANGSPGSDTQTAVTPPATSPTSDPATSAPPPAPTTGAALPNAKQSAATSKSGVAPAPLATVPPAAGGSNARAESTRSPGGSPAATAPVNSVRASLDQVESMIARAQSDTARAPVYARALLDSARAIVPRLEARQDIVELGVYTIAGYLLLGRKSEACEVLESIGAEAAQIKKLAPQVQLWNEKLNCRS